MLKKYFFTGLLVLVPLAITVWVLDLIISFMDQSILFLPLAWRPENWLGWNIPGLGTILTLLIILFTGMLATNFVGNYVINLWEAILRRIPIVNSIYSSVKQVPDTLFSSNSRAFRTTVLIEYPRKNMWTLAFVTGIPSKQFSQHIGDEVVSIYVPTTPNPTSGFFLMVEKSELIQLDMHVDEALKYIVSMGVATQEIHHKV